MKKFFLFILLTTISLIVSAQTQHGVVKTRGRMINGVLQPGRGLADATVKVSGRQAVVSQGDEGSFSFPVAGQNFRIESVRKKGYQLVDMSACTEYKFSENPLRLVMETPEQQQSDLLAAERKIRRNLQRQLQKREDEIEALKVSQQEKDSLLRVLYQQQGDNEKLIEDMAKRYSTLDYDQLDEFYRQVSWFIENGELIRADSLLRTRGDINAQVQNILKQGQAIQVQEAQLQQAKTVQQGDIDEAARRCYSYYEAFFAQHLNDSAAYYLELRASLDTTNVEWQNKAGRYIHDYIANYSKALDYYQRVLRQSLLQFGEQWYWTSRAYINIGYVYFNQGDFTKALEYYSKALTIRETILGTEHPDVATSYNYIGGVYSRQGDYTKALEYYSKALEIREEVFGTEHPDVANSYNNIGIIYSNQGDYPKALEYYSKDLAIIEKIWGTDHPDVASSYINIGYIYTHQGDYAKGLKYCSKALVIFEKVLGTEHPDVATSYNYIGYVYFNQGDYDKALEYYNKALVIFEKVLGTEHPDVATSYNNIGTVYHRQSDYAKALEYYSKALVILEKVLGTEHPYVATTNNNIGGVYDNQGDYSKALEYYSKALAIQEKVLGPEHPDTKQVRNNVEYIKTAIIVQDPVAMQEYVFTAMVVDGDTPARQQGMSGEYIVLAFADWTIKETSSLFDKNNEMRGKPKDIVVIKDGAISQHHFENTIGVKLDLKHIGKEEKSRIIKAYEDWKAKKH